MVDVKRFQPNVAPFCPKYLKLTGKYDLFFCYRALLSFKWLWCLIFDILYLALTIRVWYCWNSGPNNGFGPLLAWYLILLLAVHSITTLHFTTPFFCWRSTSVSLSGNIAQTGMFGLGPRLFWEIPANVRLRGRREADTERWLHHEETPPLGRRGCNLLGFKIQIMCVWREVTVHVIQWIILYRLCKLRCYLRSDKICQWT